MDDQEHGRRHARAPRRCQPRFRPDPAAIDSSPLFLHLTATGCCRRDPIVVVVSSPGRMMSRQPPCADAPLDREKMRGMDRRKERRHVNVCTSNISTRAQDESEATGERWPVA